MLLLRRKSRLSNDNESQASGVGTAAGDTSQENGGSEEFNSLPALHTQSSSPKRRGRGRRNSNGGGFPALLWSRTRKKEAGSPLRTVVPKKTSCNILVLLLEPKSKVFELIQLVYLPASTTIGDLLAMIPQNATETNLAQQHYRGLVRPKSRSQRAWKNPSLMASTNDGTQSKASAGIEENEVLVAIPADYSSRSISKLGLKILSSQRIQALIEKLVAGTEHPSEATGRELRSAKSSHRKGRRKSAAHHETSKPQKAKSVLAEDDKEPMSPVSAEHQKQLTFSRLKELYESGSPNKALDPEASELNASSSGATLCCIAEATALVHSMTASSPSSFQASSIASTPPARPPSPDNYIHSQDIQAAVPWSERQKGHGGHLTQTTGSGTSEASTLSVPTNSPLRPGFVVMDCRDEEEVESTHFTHNRDETLEDDLNIHTHRSFRFDDLSNPSLGPDDLSSPSLGPDDELPEDEEDNASLAMSTASSHSSPPLVQSWARAVVPARPAALAAPPLEDMHISVRHISVQTSMPRKEKLERRVRRVVSAVGGSLLLLYSYIEKVPGDARQGLPMGIVGFLQMVCVFALLVRLQRVVRRSRSDGNIGTAFSPSLSKKNLLD